MTPRITLTAAALALVAAPLLAETTVEEAITAARDAGVERVVEVKLDDGKWEIEGRDANNRKVEIDLDAVSLAAAGPAPTTTIEAAVAAARAEGLTRVTEVKLKGQRWEVRGHDADDRKLKIDVDARSSEVSRVRRD